MEKESIQAIEKICEKYNFDKTRMMDILWDVQNHFGHVPDEAKNIIAKAVNTHRVEVESVISFYAFLSDQTKGKIIIRLCNDIIDKMHGFERIKNTFIEELGININETTPDGMFTLETTPCIGLSDQAPAAIINGVMVTKLSTDRVKEIVSLLKKTKDPNKITRKFGEGDGKNSNPLIYSMVYNNLRKKDQVIFADFSSGESLKKALSLSPTEVIRVIKASRLRGRGGAGFPTGLKWEFTRNAEGEQKYIFCNADEGEPGTFKDRVILTEQPELIIEGMTIGGYAIGASKGIIYLRAEYVYLLKYLNSILEEKRKQGLLGKNILGKAGFNFDIRIQVGAGAYICGEETALISSCEGLRGDPKNRPPFPAQKGYLKSPTVVNNVETFCNVARILEKGASWFTGLGTKASAGTKVLSVSGDCGRPGVYEVPFGVTINELLYLADATDAQAVQVGGPSGKMIGKNDYNRKICFDDLATGGSIMIFGKDRNLLEVVDYFMDFFIDESCGYCTPCRVGNVLLKRELEKIMAGKAESNDIEKLYELAETVKIASRCGLGQTSPNPILTTIQNFRHLYTALIKTEKTIIRPSFDLERALKNSMEITGRKPSFLQDRN